MLKEIRAVECRKGEIGTGQPAIVLRPKGKLLERKREGKIKKYDDKYRNNNSCRR